MADEFTFSARMELSKLEGETSRFFSRNQQLDWDTGRSSFFFGTGGTRRVATGMKRGTGDLPAGAGVQGGVVTT